MIHLRKTDSRNIFSIAELTVKENQQNFIETNTESILEAYAALTEGCVALPFGIYEDDTLIGFVMIEYDLTGDDMAPQVAAENYYIRSFMIAEKFQGRGLGKAAFSKIIDYIRTFPYGRAELCWLTYETDNTVAKKLYAEFGFHENGEMYGEEAVAVMRLGG